MIFTILISKLFTHIIIIKTPKDNIQREEETSTKVNDLNNINLRQGQKTNPTINNTISTQSLNSSNKDKSAEITSTLTNKLVDTSMQKLTVENLSNSKRINVEVRCANCGALNESLNKSCHLCGMEITQKNEQKLKVKKILRYVYASIACIIVMFLHSMLCVALEWERGGGLIPVLLTFGFMSFLWKTITHGP